MTRRSDPIAKLMQEHNEALSNLKLLNTSTQSFLQNGFTAPAYRGMLTALRYIEQEVTETLGQDFEAMNELSDEWTEDEESNPPTETGGLTEKQEKIFLFLIRTTIISERVLEIIVRNYY